MYCDYFDQIASYITYRTRAGPGRLKKIFLEVKTPSPLFFFFDKTNFSPKFSFFVFCFSKEVYIQYKRVFIKGIIYIYVVKNV